MSLRVKLFEDNLIDLSLRFFCDQRSLIFRIVVCFITANVIIFSGYYMAEYIKPNLFLTLMLLFVISMLLLINIRDLFILILG